jgi:hypothetical protein
MRVQARAFLVYGLLHAHDCVRRQDAVALQNARLVYEEVD